jgi:protein arginine kinase
MNLLSGVRLGVGVGLIPDVGMYTMNKLLVHSQPAHLAAAEGISPTDPDLPIRRARFVRKILESDLGRRG